MKSFITILILLISQSSYSQISKELQKTIDKIAETNMYYSMAVGYAGERSNQWDRFEILKAKATDQELLTLTDHENPAVKCYSFQALAERKHPSTVNILIKHLHDHDTIGTFQGCIISRQLVGDFFLEIVTPNYVSNEAYKLNGKEKSTIDSVLLFDKKVQLEARNALLKAIEPLDKYYERLKEIYNKEDNPAALIAISKYKKETDIPLIKTWLSKTQTRDQYYGLRAVIHFPHAEFFPYLKHIHEQEIAKPSGFSYSLNRVLYLAIVQYQNRESRELIEYTLDKATGPALKYHYEAIWLALTKYPNSIYTGLKRNIILTESQKESLRRWLDRPD